MRIKGGAQAGSQDKDFGAVLQTKLTRVKFCLWCRLKPA